MEHREYLYRQEEFLTHMVQNGADLYGYFIRQRRAVFSDAVAEKAGIPTTIDNMPDWMVENGLIASESIGAWQALFAALEKGEKSGSARVTLRRKNGRFGRYWLHFNGIADEQGDPWFALVSYEDVTHDHEEFLLREEMRIQAEEIRLAMSQMGKVVCYYDVPSSTLTAPQSYAKLRGYSNIFMNFPEEFIRSDPEGIPPTALSIIQGFYDSIRAGQPKGSCEYHCLDLDGMECWERLEFVSVFNAEGQPQRAIITVENITEQNVENRKLKENEQLLQLLAQHSDRTLCYYDVQRDASRIWDPKICEKCQLPRLCEMTAQTLLESGAILPVSVDDVRGMFEEIRSGRPNGAIKMRARTNTGEIRWFDLQYSTIFNNDGSPLSALISHKDISEQYEHELAYLRFLQQQDEDVEERLLFVETDLTANLVEKAGGQLIFGELKEKCTHSDFIHTLNKTFRFQNMQEALRYFSRENLLYLYAEKDRWLKSEWQGRLQDGTSRWLDADVTLLADPYTDHVKAFLYMTDITGEKEAILEIQRRSELDGMTGLYNRATAEERIRAKLTQKDGFGILLLLDLDDLKEINDVFGHKEGDRAIRGIADMLKSHFRESDIIGRIGGDEFIVYLTGAAENRDSIAISVNRLLRRLSGMAIGNENERRIHCSIGGVVQTVEADSFETLYKMADKALYHVKRSGKNNFAFYTPEMELSDYQFQKQRLFSLQSRRKFETEDLQQFLNAIASYYQLVLALDLSTNDYYLMEATETGIFSKIPSFGILDHFVKMAERGIHPDDVGSFHASLSREALLQAYGQGAANVQRTFRFHNGEEYAWVETVTIFYTNENGDVCGFTLVRWAPERASEPERL